MRWCLVFGLLFAVGCSASTLPTVPAWPALSEVERISVVVSGKVSDLPALAEFELPNEFIPDVLKVFTPLVYYPHPLSKSVDDVGVLRIECRDGRVINVQLLFSGKGPVLFIFEGVLCIRGGPYIDLSLGKDKYLPEVLTLEGYLRAIQSGSYEKAKMFLKLLNQSAGRKDNIAEPGGG